MGQLLVMLIVPPVVGVVTYIIIRRIWERRREWCQRSRQATRPLLILQTAACSEPPAKQQIGGH